MLGGWVEVFLGVEVNNLFGNMLEGSMHLLGSSWRLLASKPIPLKKSSPAAPWQSPDAEDLRGLDVGIEGFCSSQVDW